MSGYNYAENEPVGHIDLWGLQASAPDAPGDKETYSGGTLPTVVVIGDDGSLNDGSVDRYDFGGTLSEWQQLYGCEGCSGEQTYAYWLYALGGETGGYEEWIAQQDREEAARIAMEKMLMFVWWYNMVSMVVAPAGGGGPINGMNYRGPGLRWSPQLRGMVRAAKGGAKGWQELSSIDEVMGVPGIYQFPHAGRGYLTYVGQSGNLGVRLSTHLGQGNVGGTILYRPMLGGSTKLGREIAETQRILRIGGEKPLLRLANERMPVSRVRAKRLGLNLYKP